MTKKILTLALALGFSPLTCLAATTPGDRLATFDANANASLPHQFDLPSPDGGDRRIALLEKLPAEVAVNGLPAAIFLAEIDGRPGTIVRLGDALDITLDEDDRPPPDAIRPMDRELDLPVSGSPMGPAGFSPAIQARNAEHANGVDVWIFLHDTSGEADHAKFLSWYAAWWLKDMQENVTPGVPVRISVHDRIPGLTDIDYHEGLQRDRIRDVARLGAGFARSWDQRVTPLTKFVLFVDEPGRNWDEGTVGGALEPYGAAIASNRGHRHVFAHEVGHLLGARHEDAERKFLCVTNMKDMIFGTFSCKNYSEANNGRIRQYVGARRGG